VTLDAINVEPTPTIVDLQVTAFAPASFRHPLLERCDARFCLWIVRGKTEKHANPSHALGLLRARRKGPHGCRAAEERNRERQINGEIAPPHLSPSLACAAGT